MIYSAFFRGQFGKLFSYSIDLLAENARISGIDADVYDYTDEDVAIANIDMWKRKNAKIALIGYSLGVTTATYLQTFITNDLTISIAASTLGLNHAIDSKNTKWSVLYRGTDFLSSAGGKDDYNKVVSVSSWFGIPIISHIGIPFNSVVTNGVLNELGKLR